jgi:hypothetical protein
MSTKANEPAGEEIGKVTSIPEQIVAANEEVTVVSGEQPHDAVEGALLKTNTGTAHADGNEEPTVFQTNDGRLTPLVKAVVTFTP